MNTEHAPSVIGQTLMRVVLGLVVGGHAVEKLLHLRAFQGELILVGVPRPEFAAFLVLALELAAGLMLLMGRFTRVAGLATLFDAVIAMALIGLQHRMLELHLRLESAALVGAASFYLLTSGRGWFDAGLLRRRRANAGDDSRLWQHPTLAATPETVIYETPEGLVYEAPLLAVDATATATEVEIVEPRRRVRRRWFARHVN